MRHIPAGPPPAKIDGVYDQIIDEAGWDNDHCGGWIVQIGDYDPHTFLVFHYSEHEALDAAATVLHEIAPGRFTDVADVEFTEDENHSPIDHYNVTDTDWYLQDDGSYLQMKPYHDWPTENARYEFITLHCIREQETWSVNDATQRGYVIMPKEPTLDNMLFALKQVDAINMSVRKSRFMMQPDTAEGTHTLQDGRKSKDTYGKYEYEFRRVK